MQLSAEINCWLGPILTEIPVTPLTPIRNWTRQNVVGIDVILLALCWGMANLQITEAFEDLNLQGKETDPEWLQGKNEGYGEEKITCQYKLEHCNAVQPSRKSVWGSQRRDWRVWRMRLKRCYVHFFIAVMSTQNMDVCIYRHGYGLHNIQKEVLWSTYTD